MRSDKEGKAQRVGTRFDFATEAAIAEIAGSLRVELPRLPPVEYELINW